MDFRNKIVIITGASSGIGLQTAKDLANKHAVIILLARDIKKLEQAHSEILKISIGHSFYSCDVSNESQVKETIKKVYEKYKRIDILINNAGFGIYKDFMSQSQEEISSQINTNFYSIVYLTKAVVPIMKDQKSGHIINIASVAGKSGYPLVGPYCASKFAVIGLSEALYAELSDYNINISIICPGAVNTNFFNHPSFKKFPHEKRHKHMLQPSKVSNAIQKALKTKKFEIVVPFRGRIILLGKEFLRQTYMNVLRKLERE
jgi:uncharacterized protein